MSKQLSELVLETKACVLIYAFLGEMGPFKGLMSVSLWLCPPGLGLYTVLCLGTSRRASFIHKPGYTAAPSLPTET